ncbi:MAG: FliM/FliN family flagellar motor C-terminal domain-containing protein [Planctomycetota bacterium]
MGSDLKELLSLETPIRVRLGDRELPLRDILALAPGSIIELPQRADDELTLFVNNKAVGLGNAVKVGENFGLRLTFIGDVRERLEAIAGGSAELPIDDDHDDTMLDADAMAEALLSGQL